MTPFYTEVSANKVLRFRALAECRCFTTCLLTCCDNVYILNHSLFANIVHTLSAALPDVKWRVQVLSNYKIIL